MIHYDFVYDLHTQYNDLTLRFAYFALESSTLTPEYDDLVPHLPPLKS